MLSMNKQLNKLGGNKINEGGKVFKGTGPLNVYVKALSIIYIRHRALGVFKFLPVTRESLPLGIP